MPPTGTISDSKFHVVTVEPRIKEISSSGLLAPETSPVKRKSSSIEVRIVGRRATSFCCGSISNSSVIVSGCAGDAKIVSDMISSPLATEVKKHSSSCIQDKKSSPPSTDWFKLACTAGMRRENSRTLRTRINGLNGRCSPT